MAVYDCPCFERCQHLSKNRRTLTDESSTSRLQISHNLFLVPKFHLCGKAVSQLQVLASPGINGSSYDTSTYSNSYQICFLSPQWNEMTMRLQPWKGIPIPCLPATPAFLTNKFDWSQFILNPLQETPWVVAGCLNSHISTSSCHGFHGYTGHGASRACWLRPLGANCPRTMPARVNFTS